MNPERLLFYNNLRSIKNFRSLLDDFYSRSEEIELIKSDGSKVWEHCIIEGTPPSYITLESYLKLHSLEHSQALLISIETEIEGHGTDEKKEMELSLYEEEILKLLTRLKKVSHLKYWVFFIEHLEYTLKTLQESHVDSIINNNQTKMSSNNKQKLQWMGGVASLATLFHELSTNTQLNGKGINLVATPDQIKKFIVESFVDEKGNVFSEASLIKYLTDPEKKAKRDRIDPKQLLKQ